METMRIGKAGIPPGFVLHHFQQHALHAIGQRHLRQSSKVLKGLHQAANEGWSIAPLHKRDKAHARISQNRHKTVKFMRFAFVLVHKLAPIKLHLLTRLGLIALHWRMPCYCRPQGMDKFFQDTDPSRIPQLVQAIEENLTIRAMVLHDPLLDLFSVWIKLGRTWRTWFGNHRFWMFEIFAHGRTRDAQLVSNFLHTLPLCIEIVYRVHCLAAFAWLFSCR
jgi:hypothetical protein